MRRNGLFLPGAVLLALLFAACGGSGGGDAGGPKAPLAPESAPGIFINGTAVTAVWNAVDGMGYYVYYGANDFNSAASATAKAGPFMNSPAAFNIPYSPGYYYFRMTRFKAGTSLESALSPPDAVPLLTQPPPVSITEKGEYNNLSLAQGGAYATGYRFYAGTSGIVNAATGTLVGGTADYWSGVDHAVTEFFDGSGNPRTYYYIAEAYYSDGTDIKSVRSSSSASSSTPALAGFKTHSGSAATSWFTNPSQADGGLMDLAGSRSTWVCSNGQAVCYYDYGSSYPTAPSSRGAAGSGVDSGLNKISALTAEDDFSYVYFLFGPSLGVMNTTDGTNFRATSFGAPLRGIAQDDANLYLNTGTDIHRVAKGDLADGFTPTTALASGLSGVHALEAEGSRLFFADDSGVRYLDIPGGGLVNTVTSAHTSVTSIAAIANTVYFIADSATGNCTQSIYSVDLLDPLLTVNTVQENLYDAKQLTVQGGMLYWVGYRDVYSAAASGGTVQGRLGNTAHAIAFDANGYLLALDSASLYRLPASWSYPVFTPVTPASIYASPFDGQLSASVSQDQATDYFEMYLDGVFDSCTGTGYAVFQGLTNGDVYAVRAVPGNVGGLGTGVTAYGSPNIGTPSSLSLTPGAGEITLSFSMAHPYARDFQVNVFRDITPVVNTGATPVMTQTYTLSPGFTYPGFITNTVTDTGLTNGVTYYYNITVSDVGVANVTTGNPALAAGAEPHTNAAPATAALVDTNGPDTGSKYHIAKASGKLYWLQYSGATGWTQDGTAAGASFAPLDGAYALASDNVDLYAARYGSLVKISNLASTPTTTEILSSAVHPDLNGWPESIAWYNDGSVDRVLVGVRNHVVMVDTADPASATTLYSAPSINNRIMHMVVVAGTLYFTVSNYSTTDMMSADLSTGAVSSMFQVDGQVVDLAAGATDLYWITDTGNLSTVPLAGGSITSLGTGTAVAVNPLNDTMYWMDSIGIHYLDAGGKAIVYRVKGDSGLSGVEYMPDSTLHSFGNNLIQTD